MRGALSVSSAATQSHSDYAGRPAADPPDAPAVPVNRDELSPLTFLRRAAAFHGDRIAASDDTRTLDYRTLQRDSEALARALRKAGVQHGETVAVLAPNVIELLVAHFAVPRAGAVLCAINIRLSGEEIAYIVGHARARVLIVHPSLEASATEAIDRHRPVVWRIGAELDAALAAAPSDPLPAAPRHEDNPISVNYTSGTTGRPKGVIYTHRGAYLMALGEALETRLQLDTRYLWTLPMFHCNGWCHPWAVAAVAGEQMLLERVDPAVVWRRLQGGVTHLCAAPTVLISLAAHPYAAPLKRPLIAETGGAPPSPSLLARMEQLNIDVVHVYGLTETYGPATVCERSQDHAKSTPDERARLRARQGVPFKVAGELRVVDATMRDVPADGMTLGEVVFRGNSVMSGYLNDPEATARSFAGGWFHSGDAAVQHPDRNIELRDRFKDVIISGGENISSIEVEQALCRHPAVLEVAVIGVPHDHWGERPKAFVTLNEGAPVTPDELLDFARASLPGFKCPDEVAFGPLPKTATGKIRKNVLRDAEWKGRERRVN